MNSEKILASNMNCRALRIHEAAHNCISRCSQQAQLKLQRTRSHIFLVKHRNLNQDHGEARPRVLILQLQRAALVNRVSSPASDLGHSIQHNGNHPLQVDDSNHNCGPVDQELQHRESPSSHISRNVHRFVNVQPSMVVMRHNHSMWMLLFPQCSFPDGVALAVRANRSHVLRVQAWRLQAHPKKGECG